MLIFTLFYNKYNIDIDKCIRDRLRELFFHRNVKFDMDTSIWHFNGKTLNIGNI